MREIKFRGKCLDDGEWIYGGIIFIDEGEPHIFCSYSAVKADPATIGQFTGLRDKDGKEIYEGDICKTNEGCFIVKWSNEAFAFVANDLCDNVPFLWFTNASISPLEVIGNIHDNPDLLNQDGSAD